MQPFIYFIYLFFYKDNHDLISLKLYQLTVLRSKLEEDDEEEVTVPSVDNMELIRSKTGLLTLTVLRLLFRSSL